MHPQFVAPLFLALVTFAQTSPNMPASPLGSSAIVNWDLSRSKTPGQNFDLSHFKLQLPVANGRGGVVEIKQPELSNYTSQYFFTDPNTGAMVFYCPDNGATTKGSHYPRTELRDMREWTLPSSHSMKATLAVLQQPSTKSIIIGQIHGNLSGSEALKIRWVDGSVIVGVKTSRGSTEKRLTIAKDLSLGQTFSYLISQVGHKVTIAINETSVKATLDASWETDSLYFKAGNYLQDDSASGSGGKVVFYSLSTLGSGRAKITDGYLERIDSKWRYFWA